MLLLLGAARSITRVIRVFSRAIDTPESLRALAYCDMTFRVRPYNESVGHLEELHDMRYSFRGPRTNSRNLNLGASLSPLE